MDAVKAFNHELSSLYEVKPPISKAKMTALTRGAIKAIKFYKHVVQSVEKFILKCKAEYKVPGLYVIDSIVRQSRHQFGPDKDVFAPRFAKNMQQTFINLFKCPPEDKSKIIRVLNLWQKNQVFPPEVIQPLFDLADPNNPIHNQIQMSTTPVQQQTPANGVSNNNNASSTASQVIAKGSPAMQKTPTKGSQQANENAGLTPSNTLNLTDPNVLQQLQQLQRLLAKTTESTPRQENQVHFDKKLLDFDYDEDEDEVVINPSPRAQPPPNPSDPVTSLLTNPEVLRQLQTLQNTLASAQQSEMDMDKMKKLQEMKMQEDEFDKHLAQTVPNLPFAAECDFKPLANSSVVMNNFYNMGITNQESSGYKTAEYEANQQQQQEPIVVPQNDSSNEIEVITLDHDDSRSPEDRFTSSKRRRSRSRSKGRDRDRDRRSRRSRSRSRSRRHRSRSRDRKDDRDSKRDKDKKKDERDSEKEKERKKRGLPTIKKDNLSVCSTTLWVGHLSKLVHQDDLSNTFGEFGDIVSIDLIPPRGCAFIVMHRRQDAARCLVKLKNHMLHAKAITLAWAPGKGVKGKDLKDYWEGDLGVSYIPWSKLKEDIDIEMLEDGGMIDEDTMPTWMKAKVEEMNSKKAKLEPPPPPQMLITSDPPPNSTAIDTSQPPPMPGAGLMQPQLLPLVSPFQFNNRLLGMSVPPTMMPNIPIGVPPPNMPGAMMPPGQLLGIGSPFQGPPGMLPPQLPPSQPPPHHQPLDNHMTPPPKPPMINPDVNLKALSESLMNMTQPFGSGIIPQPPPSLPPREDSMDVEMEDAGPGERTNNNAVTSTNEYGGSISSNNKRVPLSEQLEQSIGSGRGAGGDYNRDRNSRGDDRRDGGRRGDDRGRRRSRSRDRERGRNYSRDRDRERDRRDRNSRDRNNRDRNRSDDRRDRGNRWGPVEQRDRRDESHDTRREREKTLNDRLKEMAGMASGSSDDRYGQRDRRNIDDEPRRRSSADRESKEKDSSQPAISNKIEGDIQPITVLDSTKPAVPDTKNDNTQIPPMETETNENVTIEESNDQDVPSEGLPPSFDTQMPPFDQHNQQFDQQSAPFNEQPPSFDHQAPPFDHPAPPFDQQNTPLSNMFQQPPQMFDNRPQIFNPDGGNFQTFDSDAQPSFSSDGPPFDYDRPQFRRDGPPFGGPRPPFNPDGGGPPFGRFNRDFGQFPDNEQQTPPFGSNRDFEGGPPRLMGFDGPPPPSPDRFNKRGMARRGDFRDDNRHMRGGGGDFFPGDDFGPRGPPMNLMRGDFGSRGMRGGPRGQFGGPRGIRGPRGPPFRDGQGGFNPRFDGPPDFFRGPRGPPRMFDERFSPRHRGAGRFPGNMDRRRPPFNAPDFDGPPGQDFDGPPRQEFDGPPRFQNENRNRRSRWGSGNENEGGDKPVIEEISEGSGDVGDSTPLRDEATEIGAAADGEGHDGQEQQQQHGEPQHEVEAEAVAAANEEEAV